MIKILNMFQMRMIIWPLTVLVTWPCRGRFHTLKPGGRETTCSFKIGSNIFSTILSFGVPHLIVIGTAFTRAGSMTLPYACKYSLLPACSIKARSSRYSSVNSTARGVCPCKDVGNSADKSKSKKAVSMPRLVKSAVTAFRETPTLSFFIADANCLCCPTNFGASPYSPSSFPEIRKK